MDKQMMEQNFIPQSGMKTVPLTKTEQRLLDYLQRHGGEVATRQELMENVWETHGQVNTRTVDIHISHLRRKLCLQEEIKTVSGAGYSFSTGSHA